MIIRKALASDAAKIAAIYNYYIKHTIVTFEESEVSESTIEKRIAAITVNYPYLVIFHENELIGFAYAFAWKERGSH